MTRPPRSGADSASRPDAAAIREGDPVPAPLDPLPHDELVRDWPEGARPMVSVLCHTFQHGPYVEHALNGILAQRTPFPFELIIHDDASTDGTIAIVERYARAYPSVIKLILQEQNQYSRGRRPFEFTVDASRGTYIAVCEGDDYWTDPSKLRRQVEALEQRPDCVLAGHDYLRAEGGVVECRHVHPPSTRRDQPHEALLRAAFYYHTNTWMFRRPSEPLPVELTRVRNEDRLLISWLGHFGASVYVEGIQPTVYQRHGGGVWASQDQRQQSSHHLTTWFWIATMQDRLGRPAIAAHFYGLMMLECLKWQAATDPKQTRRILRRGLDLLTQERPVWRKAIELGFRLRRRVQRAR